MTNCFFLNFRISWSKQRLVQPYNGPFREAEGLTFDIYALYNDLLVIHQSVPQKKMEKTLKGHWEDFKTKVKTPSEFLTEAANTMGNKMNCLLNETVVDIPSEFEAEPLVPIA